MLVSSNDIPNFTIANKSPASAASIGYAKFQTVIKSAASAASLGGGRASARLDHGFFFAIFGRASAQNIKKIVKIPDFVWWIGATSTHPADFG